MKLIFYKDCLPVNLSLITTIEKYEDDFMDEWLIIFDNRTGGLIRWQFVTENERNEVYNRILAKYAKTV